jgi:hypothetical protein
MVPSISKSSAENDTCSGGAEKFSMILEAIIVARSAYIRVDEPQGLVKSALDQLDQRKVYLTRIFYFESCFLLFRTKKLSTALIVS